MCPGSWTIWTDRTMHWVPKRYHARAHNRQAGQASPPCPNAAFTRERSAPHPRQSRASPPTCGHASLGPDPPLVNVCSMCSLLLVCGWCAPPAFPTPPRRPSRRPSGGAPDRRSRSRPWPCPARSLNAAEPGLRGRPRRSRAEARSRSRPHRTDPRQSLEPGMASRARTRASPGWVAFLCENRRQNFLSSDSICCSFWLGKGCATNLGAALESAIVASTRLSRASTRTCLRATTESASSDRRAPPARGDARRRSPADRASS